MKTSGYSGTPLAKKLGIKEGFKVRLVDVPEYYMDLFDDMPGDIHFLKDKKTKKNFIHYFTKDEKAFLKDIGLLRNEIEPNGMIWISWPKKTSKLATNITEDIIRNIALQHGLVDIKVCAVDDVWSGLKLVIPVKERRSYEL